MGSYLCWAQHPFFLLSKVWELAHVWVFHVLPKEKHWGLGGYPELWYQVKACRKSGKWLPTYTKVFGLSLVRKVAPNNIFYATDRVLVSNVALYGGRRQHPFVFHISAVIYLAYFLCTHIQRLTNAKEKVKNTQVRPDNRPSETQLRNM